MKTEELIENLIAALEANYIINRRIYDTLLVMLEDQNSELAKRLDETHDQGGFVSSDVRLRRD